jgi:hypothetical protein
LLLSEIEINSELLPLITSAYSKEIAEKLGHLRPDERHSLVEALKEIDDDETRMARLLVSKKISAAVWDRLWSEW